MRQRAVLFALLVGSAVIHAGATGVEEPAGTAKPPPAGSMLHADGPHPDGPVGLLEFGRLVGNWRVSGESLQPDGTWKIDTLAEWNFFWTLNGFAIADEWIEPPRSVERRGYMGKRLEGVNLRLYHPRTSDWSVVWFARNSTEVPTMRGTSSGRRIVLMTHRRNERGFYSRVTFFNIRERSFEWKMEWSGDRAKGSWFDVSRLHASRATPLTP